jgi:hypothetical protein
MHHDLRNYELLHGTVNQLVAFAVPRMRESQKQSMGDWVFTRDRCKVTNRTFLAMGMRVPKSASSTLQDLVVKLSRENMFALSSVVQRHSQRHINRSDEESRLVTYLSTLPRRSVHTAHVPFLNFGTVGRPRPVYFSTMRDPYKRLVSHYGVLLLCDLLVTFLTSRHLSMQSTNTSALAHFTSAWCIKTRKWSPSPTACEATRLDERKGRARRLIASRRQVLYRDRLSADFRPARA